MDIMGTSCCGVNEIDGVSYANTPVELVKEFLQERQYVDRHVFIYTFTDAKTPHQRRLTMGDKFANYIEKHGLGTVVRSAYKRNPNSGNNVRVFVWTTSAKLEKMYESFCLWDPEEGPQQPPSSDGAQTAW